MGGMTRSHLLVALALLAGCRGSDLPLQQHDGRAAAPALDGWSMSADTTVDAGRAPDAIPTSHDGHPCPAVAAGRYTGKATGDRTGTVALEVVSAAGALSLAASSNVTLDGKVFPLVMSSITCGHLEAAIGAPAGATGGTPLRGQIRADFESSPSRFEGDWNIAGSQVGTFRATR
jgi:hypothetical protein